MPETEEITHRQALQLAHDLTARSPRASLADDVAALEVRARRAGHLLHQMLTRQFNGGDVWTLPREIDNG
jgi:hypothetical protein